MQNVTVDMQYVNSRMYGGQSQIRESLRKLIYKNPVLIDTETTGLTRYDEVIDIAVVNGVTGLVEFDSLVKPKKPIPAQATAIHGITNEMVEDAPSWLDIWESLEPLITTRPLGIYNSSFDIRMIQQTCKKYNLQLDHGDLNPFCVMRMSSTFLSPIMNISSRGRVKLDVVKNALNLHRQGDAHRALSDALLTREIFIKMAGVQINLVDNESS